MENLIQDGIRNAAEGGQLYGSVTTRDIANAITDQSKINVDRTMVQLNAGFKMIGLFPVTLLLHPEVKVSVIVNIARSEEEAKIQAKTGKALVAEDDRASVAPAASSKSALMDEEALANEIAGMGEQPDLAPVEGKKASKSRKEETGEDDAE